MFEFENGSNHFQWTSLSLFIANMYLQLSWGGPFLHTRGPLHQTAIAGPWTP